MALYIIKYSSTALGLWQTLLMFFGNYSNRFSDRLAIIFIVKADTHDIFHFTPITEIF